MEDLSRRSTNGKAKAFAASGAADTIGSPNYSGKPIWCINAWMR